MPVSGSQCCCNVLPWAVLILNIRVRQQFLLCKHMVAQKGTLFQHNFDSNATMDNVCADNRKSVRKIGFSKHRALAGQIPKTHNLCWTQNSLLTDDSVIVPEKDSFLCINLPHPQLERYVIYPICLEQAIVGCSFFNVRGQTTTHVSSVHWYPHIDGTFVRRWHLLMWIPFAIFVCRANIYIIQ